ncbi:hypothetical protein [Allomesorhizobium camelthorni]|uniref:Uncharacterized protein n=1 Tax=Allomesorhizobium camelthorni TaxID=475069 RepID=A0A6G4WJH8_9HYPH|nr:hypothetical protein [Mesorhizobium camelthorni]NGO54237.1 hypothetical protein [Mesorhizobium camelthorni]
MQNCVSTGAARHALEGERRENAFDQGDIRREPRHAFVHVIERLQIWTLHHEKERLLELIGDRRGCCEYLVETLFDAGKRE